MFGKVGKAVLITTGAFWMFSLAFETGKFAVVIGSPPHCLAGSFGQSGGSLFSALLGHSAPTLNRGSARHSVSPQANSSRPRHSFCSSVMFW